MKRLSYLKCLISIVAAACVGAGEPAVAQEEEQEETDQDAYEVDTNDDDTADIDTASTVDTVSDDLRRFTLNGDFRPLLNYADRDNRPDTTQRLWNPHRKSAVRRPHRRKMLNQ